MHHVTTNKQYSIYGLINLRVLSYLWVITHPILYSFFYLPCHSLPLRHLSHLTYLVYDDLTCLIFLLKAETDLFQLQISATLATTTLPGEAIAQAKVPMHQPPCLLPNVMLQYSVDPACTSSVDLSPSLGPNISLPVNRPKTFNDTQFLGTGGYYIGDSPDTGQHICDGIDGEHFVSSAVVVLPGCPNFFPQIYNCLLKMLPRFGPDNWTSELRKEVEGFTPCLYKSIADFTYPNNKGTLTAMLYGESQREMWKDQWPTYYLEVKSTSHGHHEPFHMSQKQIDKVCIDIQSDL